MAEEKYKLQTYEIDFKTKFCEYCNEDSDGYVKPLEKNCHAFIRFGMNGWVLSLKGGGWQGECRIRYCPMCGRDLLVKRGWC